MEFSEARACVLQHVCAGRRAPAVEEAGLESAAGRVLAEDVHADRDYPPVARSIRDGYAVRASDVPGELEIVGEVRAGATFQPEVARGQAVEIMTGAPVPRGADAVVMIEQTTRAGSRVHIAGSAEPAQFINPQASEARRGNVVLHAGKRLDYSDIAMLATVGCERARVYTRPTVAILATGDEIVPVHAAPAAFQIRNSNVYSLAAQVARSGGVPRILGVARDEAVHTRELIERGLEADLLLISGGVSAGKYDIVEPVLAGLGAEFYFTRVLIQPGQPLVFGRARGRFFFGLPGNPASTMVTFELFARAALELLAGQEQAPLHLPYARLAADFRHKPGLTRFLPAQLSEDGAEITHLPWHGSSDVPALQRANAFLVADADRAQWVRGELIRVLLK